MKQTTMKPVSCSKNCMETKLIKIPEVLEEKSANVKGNNPGYKIIFDKEDLWGPSMQTGQEIRVVYGKGLMGCIQSYT